MHVIVADPVITVQDYMPAMMQLGHYRKRIRKSPEDLKQERKRYLAAHGVQPKKLALYYQEDGNVIEADGNSIYFLPGLWPRIKGWLEKNKIAYTLEDKRDPRIRPEPDWTQLDGYDLRDRQDTALALMTTLDCGVINTTTSFGKSFCVGLMCRLYPTLNILVTTKAVSVVDTLCRYLNEMCPGEVGVRRGGKDTTNGKRIIICTFASLDSIPADKPQLVFVDESHDVGDGEAAKSLMKFCFARRFGFSASPIRGDGTGLVMESIVGPEILKMTYQEAVDKHMVTPMKYYMIPVLSGPPICHNNDLPDFMMKRYAYWRNTARNKAIQKLVYDIKSVYDGQILIMVSTLEAALALNQYLPWFKVLYNGAAEWADMKRKFKQAKGEPPIDFEKYKLTAKQLDIAKRAIEKGTLRYVITTKIIKQGFSVNQLDVLIRADGDISEVDGIQIPGRLARLDEGKDFAYLIDCDDRFCGYAARRSEKRKEIYDQQQWKQISREELINDLARSSKGHFEGAVRSSNEQVQCAESSTGTDGSGETA